MGIDGETEGTVAAHWNFGVLCTLSVRVLRLCTERPLSTGSYAGRALERGHWCPAAHDGPHVVSSLLF
jgi:hypothetical protein